MNQIQVVLEFSNYLPHYQVMYLYNLNNCTDSLIVIISFRHLSITIFIYRLFVANDDLGSMLILNILD